MTLWPSGVQIKFLEKFSDDRGWLCELFRSDEPIFPSFHPQMGYASLTLPGVVRGPHEHKHQTDYMVFAGLSRFTLYLWDSRPGAPWQNERFPLVMAEQIVVAMLIPPGIVHAYKNVGQVPGLVLNFPNELYRGPGRAWPVDEVRYEGQPDCPYVVD